MTAKTLRTWYLVHKWTSLISTIFLLMLCLTGLPLIFHEEIEHYFEPHPQLEPLTAESPRIDYDDVIARALAARPGEVVRFLVFEKDDPLGLVISAPSLVPPPENGHMQPFDARTGEFFDALPPPGGFMYLMLKLHTDLFLGLPGYLFLGLMGLLLVASLVSGVVVYTPFMRKLDFATVRAERSRRLKWLDLHNLLGIVTLSWVLVVGVTGVINTLALPILMLWQGGQLAEMTAPYKDAPPLQRLGSLDAALATARRAAPDMEVSFVGFPGTQFSSQHHYAVFMRGNTPLTERLLKPALIDAQTGELTDMREMPLYVKTLLLSQPLHFGNYGGMPLKIVWALLDLISIVILASGLYLWLGRRKTPLEKRLAELPGGSLATEGKA
ncbi:PepSY domain-containing protein [Pseudomonas aeruginosa]|uniref:PepSY-associated TM helix domain-containing protein n=1 Tax=Pseudomonas aeruginosa TaxID=287 RepID=UPI001067DDC0|nr:PepSY domain-containing protein [Pseudomonas aeruginosa]TEL83046.1 PepSY domain-containing protein [Pseudomonas aeruginosa]